MSEEVDIHSRDIIIFLTKEGEKPIEIWEWIKDCMAKTHYPV